MIVGETMNHELMFAALNATNGRRTAPNFTKEFVMLRSMAATFESQLSSSQTIRGRSTSSLQRARQGSFRKSAFQSTRLQSMATDLRDGHIARGAPLSAMTWFVMKR